MNSNEIFFCFQENKKKSAKNHQLSLNLKLCSYCGQREGVGGLGGDMTINDLFIFPSPLQKINQN